MRKSYAVGLMLIAGFTLFGASAFKNAATPYVNFRVARAATAAVQVKGSLEKNTIQVDRQTHALRFALRDSHGDVLPVSYSGPEPGNFRQAQEVVAIGRYNGQFLEAENLLVKCPSKYQRMGKTHPGS